MTKPTIILVPGAWHPASLFQQVASLLERAGHLTISLDLVSCGADPPVTGIDEDVALIRAEIEGAANNGEDIILFMHSFGGIGGSSACRGLDKGSRLAQGKTGGIVHLIYCASFILPEGSALLDVFKDNGISLSWFKVSDDKTIVRANRPEEVFYNDMSPEAAQEAARVLKHHCYKTFESKVTYSAYKDIPSTYLFCERDNAVPLWLQKTMVERAGVEFDRETFDAGHSPFLSMPDRVVKAIRRAAGETITV